MENTKNEGEMEIESQEQKWTAEIELFKEAHNTFEGRYKQQKKSTQESIFDSRDIGKRGELIAVKIAHEINKSSEGFELESFNKKNIFGGSNKKFIKKIDEKYQIGLTIAKGSSEFEDEGNNEEFFFSIEPQESEKTISLWYAGMMIHFVLRESGKIDFDAITQSYYSEEELKKISGDILELAKKLEEGK